MVNHTSATTREETPHVSEPNETTETPEPNEITISDALRRRAQSVIDNIWIDRRWRAVIRYGLETNDPALADLVRRADAGERIVDTIDFSQTTETVEDVSAEEKIEALAEIICRAGGESSAALLVLMGLLENSADPKVHVNTAKHFAFTRCGELNLYGMVDDNIALVQSELFAGNTFVS